MTAASARVTADARPSGTLHRRWLTGTVRLAQLYLASRRARSALVTFAASGALLRASLYWHWTPATGPIALKLPTLIEVAVASVIAVTTYSPFGESERATGRWLPYLRLASAVALTGAAIAALAIGSAGLHMADGDTGIARNVAGLTGLGLLCAPILGGALSWIAPVAYGGVAEYAIASAWTSPWTWPARSPHDLGAAICAALACATGLAMITALGPRYRDDD
jgi:hypothetical protein